MKARLFVAVFDFYPYFCLKFLYNHKKQLYKKQLYKK